ncbi:MAG: Na+/H+ antiporter NhaC family protein [Sedimentibacter sp.]|uniref:Na+/H+ antiporter NhaC family protein n=1 Tax=Sedimentibacter sp. TaxID=1960295 RepID=UPI002980F778|nr:Na+/H+ antiporter NhaC family protein [Sedimentibacter sp.]MDW5298955.1 Na+/H+ antiporter NhaC family protein [Sedimentibacter sp.]
MDFLIAVIIFTLSLIFSIFKNISTIYPLLIGMFSFSFVATHRGYNTNSIVRMLLSGMKKAMPLMPIFALIGIITALWRASGSISFFVYYGTKFMNPDYFILFAFLLSCLVSFALGTSFGTAGTIGIVLIVLAKGGNVNINAAAGAIISGAFFGDRCSPTSSSANLVAAITETNLYDNVKNMFKTGLIPFVFTVIFYIFLSKKYPINITSNSLLNDISNYFNLNIVTVFPALIIFVLASFKKNVQTSMLFSIISAFFICIFVQNMAIEKIIRSMLVGFNLEADSSLSNIISGGGLMSMISVSFIVLIASSYTGIFEETGMLNDIQGFLVKMSNKIGVYLTTAFTSIITGAFCCNQTLPVLLTQQLMHKIYEEKGYTKKDMAIDLENTAIMISELFPWSIAIAVPLATLSVDASSIPFAIYLYLVPLINIIKLPEFKSFNYNRSNNNIVE